jgi:hypothetical protein
MPQMGDSQRENADSQQEQSKWNCGPHGLFASAGARFEGKKGFGANQEGHKCHDGQAEKIPPSNLSASGGMGVHEKALTV